MVNLCSQQQAGGSVIVGECFEREREREREREPTHSNLKRHALLSGLRIV